MVQIALPSRGLKHLGPISVWIPPSEYAAPPQNSANRIFSVPGHEVPPLSRRKNEVNSASSDHSPSGGGSCHRQLLSLARAATRFFANRSRISRRVISNSVYL